MGTETFNSIEKKAIDKALGWNGGRVTMHNETGLSLGTVDKIGEYKNVTRRIKQKAIDFLIKEQHLQFDNQTVRDIMAIPGMKDLFIEEHTKYTVDKLNKWLDAEVLNFKLKSEVTRFAYDNPQLLETVNASEA